MKSFFLNYLKYILLALLIYMPVFGFLNKLPIRIWDEARIAVNAHEMYINGNYIVTHFDNKPEMWNTKPPLLIWCQVILMKLIGPGELSVRIPSAMAVFLTSLALLFFSIRYLKNFWPGFIAILTLITSEGYMSIHIARTGDYDALLTLFTTSTCLLFYSFCETKNNKYLYWFFVCLTLAALTKGVAGLLFTPAFFIYLLFQKQLVPTLKNKHLYIGVSFFVIISVGYYFLREAFNPGYIETIRNNELGGRFFKSQGDIDHGFWFYYHNLITSRLADRYLLIPCGFIIGLVSKNSRIKRLTLFMLIACASYFLVISVAKTKLSWYDAPLYPFFSLTIAIVIFSMFDLLKNSQWAAQALSKNVLPYLFLFLLFVQPYQKVWDKTYNPDEDWWDQEFYEMGHYLKDALAGGHDLNGKYLVYGGYNAHNLFYVRLLNEQGVKTGFKDLDQIKKDDIILLCQEDLKQYVREHFKYEQLEVNGHIVVYKIL